MTAERTSSPYPGPRPFAVGEASLFFGRSIESRDLSGLVLSYPVTVLYSQSGAGKSSLVRAGVCPRLVRRVAGVVSTRVGGADRRNDSGANVFERAALEQAFELFAGRQLASPSNWNALCGQSNSEQVQVLIIDQLEELFLSRPDRWADREPFLRTLAGLVNERPNLRLLLVIREDQIAELDSFSDLFPDRLGIRYRLEPLKPEAAIEAVEGPLRSSDSTFAEGVAQALVDTLRRVRAPDSQDMRPFLAQFVEPVHLQVVCERLWRRVGSEGRPITAEDVVLHANVDDALSDYYDERIKEAADIARRREGALRNWVEDSLITSTGRRNAVHEADLIDGNIDLEAVETLVRLHLVRAEVRGDSRWFELAHDRFIEPIREANSRWREAIAGTEHYGRHLDVRAKQWIAGGRSAENLLSDSEVAQAETWIASDAGRELGVPADVEALVKTSRTLQDQRDAQARERESARVRELAVEKQSARNLRLALTVSIMFLALAIVSLLFYRRTSDRLQKQTALAQYQTLLLEAARTVGQDPRGSLAQIKTARELDPTRDPPEPELRAIVRSVSPYALGELRGNSARIQSIDLSEDGERILSASSDGRVLVWKWRSATYAELPSSGETSKAVFSFDGRRFAIGDGAGVVRVFDASSMSLLRQYRAGNAVEYVAISPTTDAVAAGLSDGSVVLWGSSDAPALRLAGHVGTVSRVAYSADGELVASAGADGRVRVWSSATGTLIKDLDAGPAIAEAQPRSRRMYALRFSQDGSLIAAGGQDRRARVWNVSTGTLLKEILHRGAVFSVDFGRPSTSQPYQLLSAGYSDELRVWRLGSRGEGLMLREHHGSVNSALYTPDGRYFVSGGADDRAIVWDSISRVPIAALEHGVEVTSVAISRNGKVLATVSQDGTIRTWDLASLVAISSGLPKLDARLSKPPKDALASAPAGPVHQVALSRDGLSVAVGLADATARLWRMSKNGESWTFTEVEVLGDLRAPARAVAFDDSGKLVAVVAGRDLYVWQPQAGRQRLLAYVGSHTSAINSVSFDGSGTRLVTASDDGSAIVWPVSGLRDKLRSGLSEMKPGDRKNILVSLAPDPSQVQTIRHSSPENKVRLLAAEFSPDGRRVITGGSDFTARIWSLERPQPQQLIVLRQAGEVLRALFSPNGRQAVTGGADSVVRVWNLPESSGQSVETAAELDGHSGPVRALTFDGRFLVSGTGDLDRAVRLWDVGARELLATFTGAADDVSGLGFDGKQRFIVASSYDGRVRAYNCDVCADPSVLIDIAERRLRSVKRTELKTMPK